MPKAKIPHLKLVEVSRGRLSDEARRRNEKEFEVLEVRNSVDWSVGEILNEQGIRPLLRAGKLTTALVSAKGSLR